MTIEQYTLRVRIPLAQRPRNGRPRIQPPADYVPDTDGGTDPHVLRNFAQAWSWRRKLERGEANTIEDIARSAGVTHRMVGRMLKLTYLAPALLEKLLLERVPPSVPVKELALVADMDWAEQSRAEQSRAEQSRADAHSWKPRTRSNLLMPACGKTYQSSGGRRANPLAIARVVTGDPK